MSYYRQLNFYIDSTVPEWYIETEDGAALLAAQIKNISYGELVRATFQLTDGVPQFNESGTLTNPWTAFSGSAAVSEVVVDNNFNWWDTCKLHSAVTSGTEISTIQIDNLSAVPRALGSIRLSENDIVHYNAYSVSNGVYTFTLADASFETAAFTPENSYSAGDSVRLVEMPVIVSAENSATPASGLFAGTLDAANPVYETLIEGSPSISNTQLEFSVYVDGRVVFRSRCIFDCLSAISPGEGVEWVRPSVWAQSDSRYLRFASISSSASTLEAGSSATVSVTQSGSGENTVTNFAFGIPRGADGVTPHIGENGHWYIGTTDTGIPAAGFDDCPDDGNFYVRQHGQWIALTGSVSVTITGTSSGTWYLDGGNTAHASGETVIADAGTHVITFGSVSGLVTPASRTVNVARGGTVSVTAAYTEQAEMYYGYVNDGTTYAVSQLTASMLELNTVTEANAGPLTASIHAPAGSVLFALVPADSGLTVVKDDGVGGQAAFNLNNGTTGTGANGTALTLDGIAYLAYGEFNLVDAETIIYIGEA